MPVGGNAAKISTPGAAMSGLPSPHDDDAKQVKKKYIVRVMPYYVEMLMKTFTICLSFMTGWSY